MTTLKRLADAQAEILKAEVASLLHNIAKLDASFLLAQASDKGEAQKKLKASGKKLNVAYQARCVFQPPAGLLKQAKTEITTLSQKECRRELITGSYWTNDEHAGLQEIQQWYMLSKDERERNPPSELAQLTWSKLTAAVFFNKLYRGNGPDWSDKVKTAANTTTLSFLGESWPLNGFLSLFWDQFHYKRGEYERVDALGHWVDRTTSLLRGLILAHGVISGAEKEPIEEEGEQKSDGPLLPKQKFFEMRLATAYGHESIPVDYQSLSVVRCEIGCDVFPTLATGALKSRKITFGFTRVFGKALGDTRRPINDVSLWDMSHPTASLFKAYLAHSVLQNGFVPTASATWNLLQVSFNGVAFWGQAHHVTDLLGRRQVLRKGLDAVQEIIEVQYPLGNEVYRDEHGSVFVVPGMDNLRELKDEHGQTLETLLQQAFDSGGLQGELMPQIQVSGPFKGKEINLAQALQKRRRENVPELDVAAKWWAKDQRPANAEICTVCGLRPVGYVEPGLEKWATSQKAKDRNVCGVCLHRRGRRAHDWARDRKAKDEKLGSFERTIWTDEVADDNGRFALVVGRFDLHGWLDGKLIPTMLKSASFARIRRCWDTTRQFWLEVQNKIVPAKVGERLRLGIRPLNVDAINQPGTRKGLGKWHTYEADVEGRRLGLCWDPNDEDTSDRNLFWTTDNLGYLARQLGFREEILKTNDELTTEWRRHLDACTLSLYEPGGYLGQDHPAKVDAEDCVVVRQERFRPLIPLMAEPATFMALVPADRAMDVVASIKKKYDTEMGRVRDRLPLHLGLVFAPRRTPLRAVLEAGRAMLKMPAEWEKWQIQATGRNASFSRNGQRLEWEYLEKMGDDETEDIWYPHLLKTDPTDKNELSLYDGDFCLVEKASGTVYIRPSRFDFEFLDTTGRRFEIHYDQHGRRPGRRARPWLLDDLERLEELWKAFCHLQRSQRNQIVASIEATRELWFGRDLDGKSKKDDVFQKFVSDTLAGAAWPHTHKWSMLSESKELVEAGVSGQLTELFELHSQILKEKEEGKNGNL